MLSFFMYFYHAQTTIYRFQENVFTKILCTSNDIGYADARVFVGFFINNLISKKYQICLQTLCSRNYPMYVALSPGPVKATAKSVAS